MDEIFEFRDSRGKWRELHVTSWEDAMDKAKEFGYDVRRVKIYHVIETYYPNEDTKVIKTE